MTETFIDGIKVMKLHETHADELARTGPDMTMFRLWALLSGAHSLRDTTPGNRVLR